VISVKIILASNVLSDVIKIFKSIPDSTGLGNDFTLASLSNLSSYKNLKYIFIKCCFNSNPSEILKFVTIDSNNIRVFYKTEIPS
jgi:hypothetical protein